MTKIYVSISHNTVGNFMLEHSWKDRRKAVAHYKDKYNSYLTRCMFLDTLDITYNGDDELIAVDKKDKSNYYFRYNIIEVELGEE